MTAYAALLRAVNVGGRKLLMEDLRAVATKAGLAHVQTFIASGNLLFASPEEEKPLKLLLERALTSHMGAEVPVMLRTAEELAAVVGRNPFSDVPGNRVAAIFLDDAAPADALLNLHNRADERIEVGEREIFVAYGEEGMGRSRLRIPAASCGTARNMNTVAKLAELARNMG